ncbi:TlpA family protein disulfide reductase, partial [Sphingobacterium kitahiroshimense]|uniref:TlpA family protein disulfide reductase n=1 Tax=Sphingobacterium kitahiroshimense TaxID=470446 RepID=UPI00320811D1
MNQRNNMCGMLVKVSMLLVVLFTINNLSAQQSGTADLGKALKIGAEFQGPKKVNVMRGNLNTVDWSSLKDKIIVLDFFDTYCATCIQAMPDLQKLQQEYSDKLQVINVTWQDKPTLEKFFAANRFLKENKVNLPIIYADTVLRKLFPFKAAPHVVMLYQGKVQAITFNRLVTAANILQLHKKAEIILPIKDDFGTVALMDASAGDQKSTGVSMSGYQDGVPSKPLQFELDSISGLFKTTISNRSIFRSLLNIWGLIQKPSFL